MSIARAAMDHDVNPNQLRRWTARYQTQVQHGCPASDPMVIDGVSIDVPLRPSIAAAMQVPYRHLYPLYPARYRR